MMRKAIQVLVDPDVYDEIDELAKRDAISKSAVTRRLILRALGR